jgi:predicted AAA+ superfamily ATPase
VSVGRTAIPGRDDLEVDFVVEQGAKRWYLQVAYALPNAETLEREVRSLRAIDDHYPKILLSLDALEPRLADGLNYVNLRAFLAGAAL